MNRNPIFRLLLIVAPILWVTNVFSQRTPDPNVGDPMYTKWGWMDANQIRIQFANHGEVAHWPDPLSGEWPRGSGTAYIDGVAVMVCVEAIDENGNTFHTVETQYREFMDNMAVLPWGFYPLPGYCNPRGTAPAMSDDRDTWPEFWPDKMESPDDPGWEGRDPETGYDPDPKYPMWNGYFGKGVKNADLETYFVMDDDKDEEFNYYPVTTDTTRRGAGIEVAVRGFQWSHVLAEDCIFWHYEITNESSYDYEKVILGFYIDSGIGNDAGSDDCGAFDLDLDIAYAWDYNNQGGVAPNLWSPVAYAGYSFLESPGAPDDGIDNDGDGIFDERRDNPPGEYLQVGHYENDIWNPDGWSWEGDEDKDWDPYSDLNGNGEWDGGEPLNDDLGADGIGPGDEGYLGPDTGEGNGVPTDGEPDFNATDKDESDQIGLTGFKVIAVHELELDDDERVWEAFQQPEPPTERQLLGVNLGMYFASGTTPLDSWQTKRFSMALLFGNDFDDLARNTMTVRAIYNANYNFAKPPNKPNAHAIAGDRRVTLYWDNVAERSYDKYLQEYDFEGYNIYRSTDPDFFEARIITDTYGNPLYRKPIAQFDLIDGKKGPHLIGIQGIHFNLGEDSDIRHSFVDTTVENGKTYYYAVVSYDYGYVARDTLGNIRFDPEGNLMGIAPGECPSTLRINMETGELEMDVNTVVITPNPPAAGYIPPKLDEGVKHITGPGTGYITVSLLIPDSLKDGITYRVVIRDSSYYHNNPTPYYDIINLTSTPPETVLYNQKVAVVGAESPIFDGIVIQVYNDTAVTIIDGETGWSEDSQCNCPIWTGLEPAYSSETNPMLDFNIKYPADYQLVFTDGISDTSSPFLGSYLEIPTNFYVWNVTDSVYTKFAFGDRDTNGVFDPRDSLILILDDPSFWYGQRTIGKLVLMYPRFRVDTLVINGTTQHDTTWIDVDSLIIPQPGDVFQIKTTKPFRQDWAYYEAGSDTLKGDAFEFLVKRAAYSRERAKSDLDRVRVVPNPYMVTASWEPKNILTVGRGERKIDFIHLPQQCTIRIYTVSGFLVYTIHHDDPIEDGAESWNLVSKDGMDIAYGIYIYHIDAPGLGEKIGKFAVIK